MCTLLFAYKAHPVYDLVFLGNRDEFKSRPSLGAHFWQTNPNVLAGIDSEKGGTWTGITKEGRLAFLTNYRDPSLHKTNALSRGYLTRDFLINSIDPEKYLHRVQLQREDYNPFNLVAGTVGDLWYYSNVKNEVQPIDPGIYGLSNGLLDSSWYKVEKGKRRLSQLLQESFSIDQLFDVLDDTEVPSDEILPKTGVPLETERMLSTIHIDTPTYGTLFKTVMLISKEGQVSFYEKALGLQGEWKLTSYAFCLEAN